MATSMLAIKPRPQTRPADGRAFAGTDGSSEPRIDQTPADRTTGICGAMSQQGGDSGHGDNRRRKNSCSWWAAATPRPGPNRGSGRVAPAKRVSSGIPWFRDHWMNSPHFCTAASAAPQGMIGTEEVEFFGEPSISLSE